MAESSQERPPHDEDGPTDTAGPERRAAPIGKGGTPNVAGSDEQQPEIAEGPVPGIQPGEEYAGPAHRPALDVDPPPRGDRERVRATEPPVWEPVTGPRSHDPGAAPEDEGIPDLQDGSPSARWSGDPQVQAVPGDAPVAAEAFGTTGAEQAAGESLDARLAQEEPEDDGTARAPGSPEPAAGRLHLVDPHSDLRAAATPDDTAGLSAEEESVRIRRETAEPDADPAAPGGSGAAEDRTAWPGIETPEEVEGAAGGADAEGEVPGAGEPQEPQSR